MHVGDDDVHVMMIRRHQMMMMHMMSMMQMSHAEIAATLAVDSELSAIKCTGP